jgi:glycerol uptake facilitator-like aquaporin
MGGRIVLATASTGFANPAVTIARALTDTFTGIAPASAPAFLLAQFLGSASAAAAASGLFSTRQTDALEALPTEGGTP